MANEQGTGKHGHKDTQEPWPHTKEHRGQEQSGQGGSESRAQSRGEGGSRESRGDGSRGQQSGSRSESRSEEQSLKEREYRDKEGNIHHHTKTYMEQHDKK